MGPLALTQKIASQNIIDLGDVSCPDGDLESSQKSLARVVQEVVSQEAFPLVLGGGHETAWGHYLGLSKYHGKLGIINFDAHFDLRDLTHERPGALRVSVFSD